MALSFPHSSWLRSCYLVDSQVKVLKYICEIETKGQTESNEERETESDRGREKETVTESVMIKRETLARRLREEETDTEKQMWRKLTQILARGQ